MREGECVDQLEVGPLKITSGRAVFPGETDTPCLAFVVRVRVDIGSQIVVVGEVEVVGISDAHAGNDPRSLREAESSICTDHGRDSDAVHVPSDRVTGSGCIGKLLAKKKC